MCEQVESFGRGVCSATQVACKRTFQTLVHGPAAQQKEQNKGRKESTKNNIVCSPIITALGPAYDNPADQEYDGPRSVKERGHEEEERTVVSGKAPPTTQHAHSRHIDLCSPAKVPSLRCSATTKHGKS